MWIQPVLGDAEIDLLRLLLGHQRALERLLHTKGKAEIVRKLRFRRAMAAAVQ